MNLGRHFKAITFAQIGSRIDGNDAHLAHVPLDGLAVDYDLSRAFKFR
jgi:hypothetical protein